MGWYIIIGGLAAYGLLCLAWAVCGRLFPAGEEGVLILPELPEDSRWPFVARYLWLRDLGLIRCPLVVADSGLNTQQRQWLEAKGIEICKPEALPAGFGIGAEKRDGTGNGDSSGHHRRGGVPEL